MTPGKLLIGAKVTFTAGPRRTCRGRWSPPRRGARAAGQLLAGAGGANEAPADS